MKKIIIIIIITIAIVGFIFYMSKNKKQNISNTTSTIIPETSSPTIEDPSKGTIVDVNTLKNKRILVEKHYINYAFDFDHKGIVICTDGTIYNFVYSSQEDLPTRPYEKIIEASDDVLSHATTFEGRVPEDELARLTDLLTTIEADYEYDNVAMDKGEDTIIYYDYEGNEIITLKSGGDSIVTNKSKNANKILTILEDYHLRLEE